MEEMRVMNWNRKDIMKENLVNSKKIFLAPLHIKLGIMKQFVNPFPRRGKRFKYLRDKFPTLSKAKLK